MADERSSPPKVKRFLRAIFCIVGICLAWSAVRSLVEDTPEQQAARLFEKLASARIEAGDFIPDDPLAQASVRKIKLNHSFIRKIEARFGDDALQDFNLAVLGGKIPHILCLPDRIDPKLIRVSPLGNETFLFDYPNLGFWPVSERDGWRIFLANFLHTKAEDVESYRKRLEREIFYLGRGVSLIESDPDLTIARLRSEMEEAFKEFQ